MVINLEPKNLKNTNYFSYRMGRHKLSKTVNCSESRKQILQTLASRPTSSNRNDIITWLQSIGLVDNYIKKLEYADVDPETVQDEIQEIWLYICEIEQNKWDQLYYQGATAIKAYISGLIYRHIHSNTSLIYNKYKKPYLFFKHLSEDSWNVFDESSVMQPTNEDYTIRETEQDRIKRLIETDNNNLYEE